MDNVTADSLERKFKGEGEARFKQIAELGGFGLVGVEAGGLDPAANLDIAGVLDPENKAVSDGNKNKIRSLIDSKKSRSDKPEAAEEVAVEEVKAA